jgi:hypothetical protein
MMETIEALPEVGRWNARDVTYWAGTWDKLAKLVPEFSLKDFRVADNMPANPYQKMVVRLPLKTIEQEIPVGVVSNSYGLAPHKMVVERCLDGLKFAGVDPKQLYCNLGLTELGEWMNFRIEFPEEYSFKGRDEKTMKLRLECFNSVDGSCRLEVLLSWFRLVCKNGMVVSESRTVISDVHNLSLDLSRITKIVGELLDKVKADLEVFVDWENTSLKPEQLKPWADKDVSKSWGKKAACRVFHICESGHDVELIDAFAKGEATEKPVRKVLRVPGSRESAQNLYDVSQALSWVATQRNSPEERVNWQSEINFLIAKLAAEK